MANLNIRKRYIIAAAVVGSFLSSSAMAAPPTPNSKAVILNCAQSSSFNSPSVVEYCDKSANVTTSCPTAGGSCAQAVAAFESGDNLKLFSVAPTNQSYGAFGIWYTLVSEHPR
jgi:hypothetical protein